MHMVAVGTRPPPHHHHQGRPCASQAPPRHQNEQQPNTRPHLHGDTPAIRRRRRRALVSQRSPWPATDHEARHRPAQEASTTTGRCSRCCRKPPAGASTASTLPQCRLAPSTETEDARPPRPLPAPESRARRAAVVHTRPDLAPPQNCTPGRAALKSGRSNGGYEAPPPPPSGRQRRREALQSHEAVAPTSRCHRNWKMPPGRLPSGPRELLAARSGGGAAVGGEERVATG
jgi:hypothetical protein